jgi:hypothetical protein
MRIQVKFFRPSICWRRSEKAMPRYIPAVGRNSRPVSPGNILSSSRRLRGRRELGSKVLVLSGAPSERSISDTLISLLSPSKATTGSDSRVQGLIGASLARRFGGEGQAHTRGSLLLAPVPSGITDSHCHLVRIESPPGLIGGHLCVHPLFTETARNSLASLARFPNAWDHAVEKNSRQSNMLEQILIGQVCNLAGICSRTTRGCDDPASDAVPLTGPLQAQ